ncbi:MAG: NIPSNAP family protein [Kordiimonadaceae bacterium]|jgi:hypothetical protein|nr:NIPSNAP family protein [Kordiimonadaceae bacterium]MBT6033929.1 NIPSNAP family protein [Kordiimonadaceae bacterium]
MKKIAALMAGLIILGFSAVSAQAADTVYELRTYTTNEGKLDDLNARFRDHTIGLFEKHGISSVGYWTPVDTPNTLIYVIKHNSRDAAAQSWKAFIEDPAWAVVAKESNANGAILAVAPESVFMNATAYSLDMLK